MLLKQFYLSLFACYYNNYFCDTKKLYYIMVDLSVEVGNLKLRSPIVVSSSGLTMNVNNVVKYANAGAGAIVMKSLFEEQISMTCDNMQFQQDYTEAYDYINQYVRNNEVNEYLNKIVELKKNIVIPVIASINCKKNDSWVDFAVSVERSGADAIEINFMEIETDVFSNPNDIENRYIDILTKLRKIISIPIWVKISYFHTSLPSFIDKIKAIGVESVTLFNRSFQADIDIENEKIISSDIFTSNNDISNTIRFVGLISGVVKGIGISASTGIHSGKDIVKMILAGASSTQMCTSIYKNGEMAIINSIDELKEWMTKHGYKSVKEFKGKLSYGNIPSAVAFERVQFMKYFSSK